MREKLIDSLESIGIYEVTMNAELIAEALIENGVTVRKRAKWDDSGRYQFMDGTKAIRCTECGCALTEIEYQKYFYNFCPVCGADMTKGGADV